MTRDRLDTNIVGDALKPKPSAAWLAEQPDESLFIAALNDCGDQTRHLGVAGWAPA